MFTTSFTLLLGIVGLVQGHAGHKHVRKRQDAPELSELLAGNGRFQAKIQAESPSLLSDLTSEGQAPPFMFLGCSDSRVSEGTIFDAAPGTLFTERNIANQFSQTDSNSNTVVSYAVAELGVKHIIVMGHYGCGGVAAAIASPPAAPVDAANGAVQSWIAPIRTLFETSTRPEIVTLRESIAGRTDVEEPEPEEPGFRALVEENIKISVAAIAATSVIRNHYASLAGLSAEEKRAEGGPPEAVFIHGWVYDIENGQIQDLNISVGPPGVAIPPAPFSAVKQAAEGVEPTAAEPAVEAVVEPLQNSDAESPATICKNKCISKRRLQGSY